MTYSKIATQLKVSTDIDQLMSPEHSQEPSGELIDDVKLLYEIEYKIHLLEIYVPRHGEKYNKFLVRTLKQKFNEKVLYLLRALGPNVKKRTGPGDRQNKQLLDTREEFEELWEKGRVTLLNRHIPGQQKEVFLHDVQSVAMTEYMRFNLERLITSGQMQYGQIASSFNAMLNWLHERGVGGLFGFESKEVAELEELTYGKDNQKWRREMKDFVDFRLPVTPNPEDRKQKMKLEEWWPVNANNLWGSDDLLKEIDKSLPFLIFKSRMQANSNDLVLSIGSIGQRKITITRKPWKDTADVDPEIARSKTENTINRVLEEKGIRSVKVDILQEEPFPILAARDLQLRLIEHNKPAVEELRRNPLPYFEVEQGYTGSSYFN